MDKTENTMYDLGCILDMINVIFMSRIFCAVLVCLELCVEKTAAPKSIENYEYNT